MKETIFCAFSVILGYFAVWIGTATYWWALTHPDLFSSPAPMVTVLVLALAVIFAVFFYIISFSVLVGWSNSSLSNVEIAVVATIASILLSFLFGFWGLGYYGFSLNPLEWHWATPWTILPLLGLVLIVLILYEIVLSAIEESHRNAARKARASPSQ